MIRISLLYPSGPGSRFDHAYYVTRHIPLVLELLGPAIRSITVERGIDPGPPWPAPAYACICNIDCVSLEAYQQAVFRHAARLQGDLPNYSDAPPIIQVGEVAAVQPSPS